MQHVEKRMYDYLETLSPETLKKNTVSGSEKPETLTTEDILVRVFDEEVHLRGELTALFWQMGINPLS